MQHHQPNKDKKTQLTLDHSYDAAIYSHAVSSPAQKHAGGYEQSHEPESSLKAELSNDYNKQILPPVGAEMENAKYDLRHIIGTKVDIDNLDPATATETDIILHATIRQRLKESTYKKHLRSIHAIMNSEVPYNPYNPDLKAFLRHLDFREVYQHATRDALRHERDAVNMLNRAFGLPEFVFRLPPQKQNKKVILPLPEVVREFWRYDYPIGNEYKKRLYKYMFFFGFFVGVRAPSELVLLKTSNIIFNANGTATIIIIEQKKNYSERVLVLPREIATDPLHKSLKNWIDKWRPETDNDSLFVTEDGRPWNVRYLGHELSQYGKLVWPQYHPYVMRHWSATARLIEQKIKTNTFDLRPVTEWLGHEKQSVTEGYIRSAMMYYDVAPYSWLSRILKHPQPKRMGESAVEPELGEKSTNGQKTSLSSGKPGEEKNGPGRI